MGEYTIQVRSFAPWEKFGGGFHGDNRGFSIAPSGVDEASSRIHLIFNVNVATGKVSETACWSDATQGSENYIGPEKRSYSIPRSDVSAQKGDNSIQVSARLEGANPLVFRAPDIDVQLRMSLLEASGGLKVDTMLGGDLFPAAEVLISDGKTSVWLAGFAPTSKSSLLNLIGSGEPLFKDNFHSSVVIKKGIDGEFVGISGSFGASGELMERGVPEVVNVKPSGDGFVTVDEWNGLAIGSVPMPGDMVYTDAEDNDGPDSSEFLHPSSLRADSEPPPWEPPGQTRVDDPYLNRQGRGTDDDPYLNRQGHGTDVDQYLNVPPPWEPPGQTHDENSLDYWHEHQEDDALDGDSFDDE